MPEPAPSPVPNVPLTFDWSLILKTLLPALLPVLVSVLLPIVERWIGIDLDDAAILKLITQIIAILIPSAAVAGVSIYGLDRWHRSSTAKWAAKTRMAEAELARLQKAA